MTSTTTTITQRQAAAMQADGIRPDRPVEIADRVYWVGHYLEGDPFQCHVYLLEAGDQSVLIDPGSKLTFPSTLDKIQRIMPFSRIRYFLCHHQDPDITGALPLIDQIVSRDDAAIVTHGRAEVLLKHYGLALPMWKIEEHDWSLPLGDRSLDFVFTPYLHFPGAFCSFDAATGTLFSSDLFGGFTEGFSLYAKDESYFAAMRPFHEHYMPSREILAHGLARFDGMPIERIAPQHGSIIPRDLVAPMMKGLKELDCGLYLLAERSTDISHLIRLNEVLRGITETMVLHRDFSSIAATLLNLARELIPVSSLEFFAEAPDTDGEILHLSPANRFRGARAEPPPPVDGIIGTARSAWTGSGDGDYRVIPHWPGSGPAFEPAGHPALVVPLFAPDRWVATGIAVLHLYGLNDVSHADMGQIVHQMVMPLQVAVERECLYRALDLERQAFYQQSIRDPLTGLYTRFYLQDNLKRVLDLNDRDASVPVGVLMLDLDHFKQINDRFGHAAGDTVLRRIGETVLGGVRAADIPVRLGGEEFAVFCLGLDQTSLFELGERLRAAIEALEWDELLAGGSVTASLGLAMRRPGETGDGLLERADQALYSAKNGGRNRLVMAP